MKEEWKSYRDSILLSTFCIALSLYLKENWLLWSGGGILVFMLLSREFRSLLSMGLARITAFMQAVLLPILGSVIYYLILTPLGMLTRVFRTRKTEIRSTFKPIQIEVNEVYFEKQG